MPSAMPIVVLARRRSRRKVRTPDSALQRPSLIGVAAEHANQSNVDLLAFQPSFVRLGGREGRLAMGRNNLHADDSQNLASVFLSLS